MFCAVVASASYYAWRGSQHEPALYYRREPRRLSQHTRTRNVSTALRTRATSASASLRRRRRTTPTPTRRGRRHLHPPRRPPQRPRPPQDAHRPCARNHSAPDQQLALQFRPPRRCLPRLWRPPPRIRSASAFTAKEVGCYTYHIMKDQGERGINIIVACCCCSRNGCSREVPWWVWNISGVLVGYFARI